MANPITCVILAKNEEKNIVDCMETLKWCSRIIVIDDFSVDRTIEVAKINGAEVHKHSLSGNFSKQRNFALEKCNTKWVFFVDADERVTEQLKAEIEKEIKKESISGFILKRKDILWKKTLDHGEMGNVKLLRLAKKNSGTWIGKVHEVWRVVGKTKELTNPLLHYPHQDISTLLSEINFYSDLRSEELKEAKAKVSPLEIIFYPFGKFIVNYFFKLGFLDGIPGLIMANVMSMHSFLVRGKLWLETKNNS